MKDLSTHTNLIFVLLRVTALAKVREINLILAVPWNNCKGLISSALSKVSKVRVRAFMLYGFIIVMVTAGVSTAIYDFTTTLLGPMCCWEWGRPVRWPGFYKLSLGNVWLSLAAVTQWWVWLVIRASIPAHLGVQCTTFYMEAGI